MTPLLRIIFVIGDCSAGAFLGVATTLAVRAVVSPGSDIVAAMMEGMMVGMLVHLVVGMVLAPLLGMFEIMVPAMFIGMYGGMSFGMRDAMAPVPLATALAVGAAFGVAVTAGVLFWNAQLRNHTRMAPPDEEYEATVDFVRSAKEGQQ